MNVSNKGEVYPNFINNWNPSTKVKEILIKLFTIFYLNDLGAVFDCKQRDEFINRPTLFYTKLRYFTKKHAILGNKLEYNNNKSWDFSYNELNLKQTNPEQQNENIYNKPEKKNINSFITLGFSSLALNKKDEIIKIKCQLNELFEDVIKRFANKINIRDMSDLWLVYNNRRLYFDVPVGDYFVDDYEPIIVINSSDISFG